MEVINQCFSMIYQVPDKVLRWIGGPQEQSAGATALASIKTGVGQSADSGASGAKDTAGRGSQLSATQFNPASIGAQKQEPLAGGGGGEAKKT